MPELRLTLLVVGLIFLVGLAWWELRRPHQVRGSDLPRPVPDPLERPPEPSGMSWSRSPDLELPRMSARHPDDELPVVEVEPGDFAALEARAERAGQGLVIEEPVIEDLAAHDVGHEVMTEDFAADVAAQSDGSEADSFHEDFAADIAQDSAAVSPVAVTPTTAGVDGLLAELGASQVADPPISDIEIAPGSEMHSREPEPAPAPAPAPAPEPTPVPAADGAALGAPDAPVNPVAVDWPDPDASQVIAVRLVSGAERFSGRAVRMAVAAEGFVLGKFSIFHKPGPDGRALLSIASLNKPGTFEHHSIDVQRYSGLNLFTVLPGPMPGPDAVDELLACAQVLSQRLRGALQDETGEPLSPARTAAMRDVAAAASADA